MAATDFAHLTSKTSIGKMELRNRMAVTAMGVSLSEEDGSVGERLIAYHEEQAKGGAGLIIAGVTGVAWPVGAVARNQTAISDDRFLPGLKALCERVHAHGAKIAAQLGASSLGFKIMVLPAASAGATLATIWFIGQFHGVISATTPIGSWTTRLLPTCSSNWNSRSALIVDMK